MEGLPRSFRGPSVKVARPDLTLSISYRPGRSRSSKRKATQSPLERTGSRIREWKRAMIYRKPEPRPTLYFLSTPSPDTSPRSSLSSPVVVSDWDADDEANMSMEDITPTRDASVGVEDDEPPTFELYAPQRPTLPDVLSNSAPPPWTLSAFTAYLSQNHCLENLEFTMDAERYRERHDALTAQLAGMPHSPDIEECRYIRMLWNRLLDAYIIPDGPREINLPSNVRDHLLSLPNHTAPPAPEQLDAAVKIVYKLMEEGILISFLNEAPSQSRTPRPQAKSNALQGYMRKRGGSDSSTDKKASRSKSRRRASPTARQDAPFSPSDPTGRLTPAMNFSKGNRTPSHTSSGSGDPGMMTDDSTSAESPAGDPLTPPHTPPSSDFGGASPKQRSDLNWKKMLGWKKKSTTGMRDSRFPTVED